jgi:hypothetical protein
MRDVDRKNHTARGCKLSNSEVERGQPSNFGDRLTKTGNFGRLVGNPDLSGLHEVSA